MWKKYRGGGASHHIPLGESGLPSLRPVTVAPSFRSILITGGTGSLGRALIHRLLTRNLAERVISLSRDEVKAGELRAAYPNDDRLRVFIGDVRERDRLEEAFMLKRDQYGIAHGVDTVVHAAALKQVQTAVYSPEEALKTNVFGTRNVIKAAVHCRVKKVLLISTDKAVEATIPYGSTKICAEFFGIYYNSTSYPQGTMTSAVRYGNVLASRGSVVPIWQDAVRQRKKLELTHTKMTRFWLTLDQAVDLVLHSIARMRGGEIFVPMLPSVRMVDVAEAVAGKGYPIIITGLRPGGEKLHELLLSQEEVRRTVRSHDLYVVKPSIQPWSTVQWPGAKLPEDFVYRSDLNERFLTVDEIREAIERV